MRGSENRFVTSGVVSSEQWPSSIQLSMLPPMCAVMKPLSHPVTCTRNDSAQCLPDGGRGELYLDLDHQRSIGGEHELRRPRRCDPRDRRHHRPRIALSQGSSKRQRGNNCCPSCVFELADSGASLENLESPQRHAQRGKEGAPTPRHGPTSGIQKNRAASRAKEEGTLKTKDVVLH